MKIDDIVSDMAVMLEAMKVRVEAKWEMGKVFAEGDEVERVVGVWFKKDGEDEAEFLRFRGDEVSARMTNPKKEIIEAVEAAEARLK